MSFEEAIRITGGSEKSPDEVLFLLGLFSGLDLGSALIEALEAVVDSMNEPEDFVWVSRPGFSFQKCKSESALKNLFRLAFETSLVDDAILQPGFFERTERLVCKYELLSKPTKRRISGSQIYDRRALDRLETAREFYDKLCEKAKNMT